MQVSEFKCTCRSPATAAGAGWGEGACQTSAPVCDADGRDRARPAWAGRRGLRSPQLSPESPWSPHNGSGTQLPQSAHCAHEDTEGGVEWGARWLAAVSADERRHLDAPAVTGPASSHAPRTRTRAAAGAVSGPCGQDTSSGKALAMLPWGVGRSEALVIYGQVSRADTVRCRGTEWWHAANQRAVTIAN